MAAAAGAALGAPLALPALRLARHSFGTLEPYFPLGPSFTSYFYVGQNAFTACVLYIGLICVVVAAHSRQLTRAPEATSGTSTHSDSDPVRRRSDARVSPHRSANSTAERIPKGSQSDSTYSSVLRIANQNSGYNADEEGAFGDRGGRAWGMTR